MNTFRLMFILAFIAALINTPKNPPGSEITLDASQVSSARDVEEAIEQATANGTRPGTVILDGSKGKFEYTELDRSINIYYSDVTLRSYNRATIGNCADGVFFDDFTANRIVIEGVAFVCLEGHSIIAPNLAQHHAVILRDNYFETGLYPAIDILQGDYWKITGNEIRSLGTAIYLNEIGGTRISHNRIFANVGIELNNSGYDNRVTNNQITAYWQGIILSGKTLGNRINANKFDRIQDAGIIFTDIVAGNQVTGNRIACWPGVECRAVVADPVNYEQNKIAGNKLVKGK